MARPTVVLRKAALELHRFGVNDLLIVVRGGQVDHFTGVAQADRA